MYVLIYRLPVNLNSGKNGGPTSDLDRQRVVISYLAGNTISNIAEVIEVKNPTVAGILVEKSFQTLVFFMIKHEIIYIFESC